MVKTHKTCVVYLILKINELELSVVVYTCNLSTWEVKAGGLEFKSSLGYKGDFVSKLTHINQLHELRRGIVCHNLPILIWADLHI